ncbi:O51F2 protein, partial [Atractosteus spatula]|nr:O51F2 protein [Atractosteus spatula]
MSTFDSMMFENATLVRPRFFYINGFSGIPHTKYYYVFLCFVYAVTVLANSFILFIIYIEKSLHTPKYMAVFNLAVVDMCGSTALIPKMIETFAFDSQFITYEACIANMFFVQFFIFLESLSLAVLAYDRFVAICFPLKYDIVITNSQMALILAGVWFFTLGLMIILVGLITTLSFCKTIVIDSYYYFIIVLILLSYVCIIFALLKIASGEQCLKAMKTCTSHLLLVTVFYIPISATYIAAIMSTLHPNTRIISTSLSSTIPPMLNPIIYRIKTEEIMTV